MQPFQLFSYSSSGNAAMAEAALQLWQLSSSLAFTAQQQQQLSCYSSAAPAAQQVAAIPAQIAMQPCSHAAVQPCSRAGLQQCSHAAMQPPIKALQLCSLAAAMTSHATKISHLAAPGSSPEALQFQRIVLQPKPTPAQTPIN